MKPEKIKPPIGVRNREEWQSDAERAAINSKVMDVLAKAAIKSIEAGADAVLSIGKDGMKLEYKK